MTAKNEITSFFQKEGEPLYEAWEIFKQLLRMCPNHGIDYLTQMQTFCQGLRPQTKLMLNASASGTMYTKIENEAIGFIENMMKNDSLIHHDRGTPHKKIKGMFEIDSPSTLLAQNKILTQ